MEITVQAPNRIDLAGGTTDLYPLYLLMDGGCTVNVGVTVNSRVILKSAAGDGVRVTSEDLKASLMAVDPALLPTEGPLGLICRAVKVCPPGNGLEIITRNLAPAGSGLGASSALLTALLRGLLEARGENADSASLVDLAAEIETASIRVPAGKQDYIGAVYGGISLIDFGYRGFVRKTVEEESASSQELERRMVLSYTGEGRFSGMNNWEITKRFIDGDRDVRESLIRIRDIAVEVKEVAVTGDWDCLPELVEREWSLRRSLAPGVSTERIESVMAAAVSAGAAANKICGAGGGGCMISIVPPDKKSAVEKALSGAGATPMPFKIDRQGLTLASQDQSSGG
jgi:D-glycero-alpha-D-manno-heptose-7-phosphate kinase